MAIRDKYQELHREGKLYGTIKRAVELRKQRDANRPAIFPRPGRFATLAAINAKRRATPTVVLLGGRSGMLAVAQDENRRYREWSLGEEAGVIGHRYSIQTTGSNSDWNKRSTFQRGIIVQSYATCTPRIASFQYCGKRREIKAPRGYRWDIDANGLVLLNRSGDDYHPTAKDLLDPATLVAKLKEGIATRRAAKAKAKQQLAMVKKAEAEGAAVCLRDSLTSGNCRAGSEAWAKNHGLDPRKHYAPSQLLAKANGDASRVAIVVAAAIRRHRVELDRGFCNLAEHTV